MAVHDNTRRGSTWSGSATIRNRWAKGQPALDNRLGSLAAHCPDCGQFVGQFHNRVRHCKSRRNWANTDRRFGVEALADHAVIAIQRILQLAHEVEDQATQLQELKQANAALKPLERSRSEFISIVSHDLRAPRTNIQTAIDLLADSLADEETPSNNLLQIVDGQIDRMARLVQDVLGASCIDTGQLHVAPQNVNVLDHLEKIRG